MTLTGARECITRPPFALHARHHVGDSRSGIVIGTVVIVARRRRCSGRNLIAWRTCVVGRILVEVTAGGQIGVGDGGRFSATGTYARRDVMWAFIGRSFGECHA